MQRATLLLQADARRGTQQQQQQQPDSDAMRLINLIALRQTAAVAVR
jgi:hypothetical protein